MDIGFYISELLEKNGEVNVPGLGHLAQAYVPGYYNETEGKFYPPHHNVQFDPQQLRDDDVLTQYIAELKNISLASSKYFTEKYITEVKEDALVKEVPIGNLGSLYTEYGKLLFKPAHGTTGDSAFFGYPPVNITRVGQEAAFFKTPKPQPEPEPKPDPIPEPEPPILNTPEPFYVSESNAPVFQSEPPIEEEIYEETESKRSYTWIILLFVLIFAALAVVGVHQYYPAQFNDAKNWIETTVGLKKTDKPVVVKKKEVVAVIPPKTDSLAADSIKKVKTADSIAAAAQQTKTTIVETKPVKQADIPVKQAPSPTSNGQATSVNDAIFDPAKPWVVLATTCATQTEADAVIANLKKKGIDAFIIPNPRDSKIYVAVAAYKSNAEAEAAVPTFKRKGVTGAYFTQITQKK